MSVRPTDSRRARSAAAAPTKVLPVPVGMTTSAAGRPASYSPKTPARPSSWKGWRTTSANDVAPARAALLARPELRHPLDAVVAAHPALGVRRVEGADEAAEVDALGADLALELGPADRAGELAAGVAAP